MEPSERRRRLKRTGWAFHLAGSVLLIFGIVSGSFPVLLGGGALMAIGFRCFFLSGRVPR